METKDIASISINTIRTLSMDAVQKANSGHPGMPMGAAPMAYVLWSEFLCHNPKVPTWENRDRFVLSAGHGSMLLYSLLHLTGYGLSLEDIKNFRQFGSKTPGHPEYGHTAGVETTTGPLGQGFATGVGMAIAESHLAARFNRPNFSIVDHYTYAIVSDGDLMEGVSSEAASLAGTMKLNKLIYLWDDNHISIEGNTDIAFTENVLERFQAYGWSTDRVTDGNDVSSISDAIKRAQKSSKPTLIAVRTQIGYGSPNRQNSPKAHGEALGVEEIKLTKQAYGWDAAEDFYVPSVVREHFQQINETNQTTMTQWQRLLADYQKQFPELAQEFKRSMARTLPDNLFADLPNYANGSAYATRQASGEVLNALAEKYPDLMGGSADLAPSNNTNLKGGGDFSGTTPAGRNIHFGVREHAMGSALNGMSLHGGIRPFGGTFLIFSDYMRPAIRLACLMKQPVVYVFTHDSIGLGEDGPTHQPIEQLSTLRAIPGLYVLRPADANETREAWKVALESKEHPVALSLTRQKVPTLVPEKANGVAKGAYTLFETSANPDLILMASGSEVHLAVDAYKKLADEGHQVRVVSFPSWELFNIQPESYRQSVLPAGVTRRIAIEAASPLGWQQYTGLDGKIIGMTTFGASGPAGELFEHFGFTVQNVVNVAHQLLS